ncbi:phytoene desaturase family protein [Kitasatospora sp. NPDC051170]|uniref:phytoene desaturase family protein n=1 Tax=Kitasatospora sp. NPDC051170 TaxID=3364056 RepID=UPI00379EB009
MTDQDDWDAVVIGSGIGGLVCAGYLAAAGRRVLVVEQHDVAGGNTHVFRRRRSYEFDVGVHYLGDCGSDGMLPAILGGLGLGDRIRFREMDQDGFDRISVPGLTLDVPAGWDPYRRRLTDALPQDAAGIEEFTGICQALAAELRAAQLSTEDLTPAQLARRTPVTVRWGRRTLERLFEHCGLSTRARTVLAAQSPNYGLAPDVSTVAIHAAVMDHYLRGAYYPVGGGQQLAAGLVEVLEAHGGELRTRCAAQRVLVEDGRVTGVLLADGQQVRAPLVVSNADYRRTVLELVGAEHFPQRIADRTREATMAHPFAILYLALDRPLHDRPNANLWWYRDADIESWYQRLRRGELDTVDAMFVSFASLKEPESGAVCPPGHSNFQVMTLCPADLEWWGVEQGPADGGRYRRGNAYLARKQQLTEAMLQAAEEALGPFRRNLTHVELATPLSQERYTRSSGGTPYGLAGWGKAGHRPDTRTTIEGLHVVGASTRHGSGIGGVAVGGISCAAEILEQPLLPLVHAGKVQIDPARLPERPDGWDALAVSRGAARRTARGLAKLR